MYICIYRCVIFVLLGTNVLFICFIFFIIPKRKGKKLCIYIYMYIFFLIKKKSFYTIYMTLDLLKYPLTIDDEAFDLQVLFSTCPSQALVTGNY